MHAEVIHFNRLVKRQNLLDYNILVIPGGFSHGDYVRAGAIWAKRLLAKLGNQIERFLSEERPILGICNGFQVLVEAGLLPLFDGISPLPEAALGTNTPPGYNCRWVHLKHESRGNCAFTTEIPHEAVVRIPIAHSEGRFTFSKEAEKEQLHRLVENDQLVLRYCQPNGDNANGAYPSNPNGSFSDIAGICNPSGTIFGLMPHPERAFYGWQLPDWTKSEEAPEFGDGKLIFDSIAKHLMKKS
jgi:phosphoribosylformylglycinamidine synthase